MLQHFNQGILKGRAVGGGFHQATHRHRGTGRILALLGFEPRWAAEAFAGEKPADPDLACDINQLQLEDRKIGIAGAGKGVRTPHGGHNRGRAARLQGADTHQVGVVEVIARVVMHQIAQHKQPQLGQPGRRFGPHPLDLRQGGLGTPAP